MSDASIKHGQQAREPDMSVRIGHVVLKNPVMTASGTCGYAHEYAPYLDLSRLGGFTTKSVTVAPRRGNPPPRLIEVPGGILNAIGLANVGLDEFVAQKVPELESLETAVFANVAGHCIEDYVTVCRRLDSIAAISGVELNVSCPNVSDGLVFGTDPGALRELVSAARKVVTQSVLIVKLTPNVTDITAPARAAIEAGADALSMVNTFAGMSINIDTWRPALAFGSGGFSGPAIKTMAVHLVYRVWRDVAREAGIPIIGMGGIQTWRDAVEFMLAGASAVAVGTALFVDPAAPLRIVDGMSAYLRNRGLGSPADLVGRVITNDVATGGGTQEPAS
jgi:dihydroorotate dehydrogenase (NAD+) catalytic subunit